MRRALVILVALTLVTSLDAAITVNGNTGACTNDANSVTYSATVAAGSYTVMISGNSGVDTDGAAAAVFTLTFNGDPLTPVTGAAATADIGGSNFLTVEQWYRKAPDVTTGNVVATWNDTIDDLCSGVVTLDGVNQSGDPYRTANTAEITSGTDLDVTFTSQNGDLGLDATGCWFGCHGGADGGQTTRVSEVAEVSVLNIDMSTKPSVGSTVAHGYTVGSGNWGVIVGASYIPAPLFPFHIYRRQPR